MKRIAIVAAALNGVIGKEGKMPWHLRDDLQLFKKQTMGAKPLNRCPASYPGARTLCSQGRKIMPAS